jgi:hypothetical protein
VTDDLAGAQRALRRASGLARLGFRHQSLPTLVIARGFPISCWVLGQITESVFLIRVI